MLCSPAVYSTIEKIPSQARRHYAVPIGRNTVADLRGFLNHLRAAAPSIPDYRSPAGDLLAAAYLAVDRNLGWLNVLMYSIHDRWTRETALIEEKRKEAEKKGDAFQESYPEPASYLQEFGRGRSAWERGFHRKRPCSHSRCCNGWQKAQRLLFGQIPVLLSEVTDHERSKLLGMKVLDASSSTAFTELCPLRADLSELLETTQREPGLAIELGSMIRAGDMKVDFGSSAGRPDSLQD